MRLNLITMFCCICTLKFILLHVETKMENILADPTIGNEISKTTVSFSKNVCLISKGKIRGKICILIVLTNIFR